MSPFSLEVSAARASHLQTSYTFTTLMKIILNNNPQIYKISRPSVTVRKFYMTFSLKKEKNIEYCL